VKERFSNVIAWVGLLYPAISWIGILAFWMGYPYLGQDIHEIISFDHEGFLLFLVFGLYPCCAVVNYLMVGRFRLLPWVEK
jgi:hypothetical protein